MRRGIQDRHLAGFNRSRQLSELSLDPLRSWPILGVLIPCAARAKERIIGAQSLNVAIGQEATVHRTIMASEALNRCFRQDVLIDRQLVRVATLCWLPMLQSAPM